MTAAATRSDPVTALATSPGSGPEFPIQVVQPYAMTLKPSLASGSIKPAFLRYSVTTSEPGASDVLTYGFTFKPFSTAFLATSPAATMTEGLDVFVQDVIAAITIAPCLIFCAPPLVPKVTSVFKASGLSSKPRSLTGADNA